MCLNWLLYHTENSGVTVEMLQLKTAPATNLGKFLSFLKEVTFNAP